MDQSDVSLLLHFAAEAPLAVPGRHRTRKGAMLSSPGILDSDTDDEKNMEAIEGMDQSAVSLLLHFASEGPLADSDSDDEKNMEAQTNEKTYVEKEAEAADEPKFKCAICMGDYVVPTTLKACGHVFCSSCIAQALKNKKECPICRTRATKRDLLEIYLS